MSQNSKHIGFYVIALLILSVVMSSFSVYTKTENKKASVEKSSKKTNEQKETISKAVELEAVIPFIEFDLIKYSYLISQLSFQEINISEAYVSYLPYTSRYFKTLLCFVIS